MDNGIDIVLEDEELEVEVQEDFLKGDKGGPGYTPVRGIDYYTEQDKQELIDELTEDIQGVKNDFNTNVATKTNEFNANVVSKTTEFNNNATNKMAEFNANTITKINEYNENAEDLINRVIEAEAENQRLKQDLNGLPSGQAEGETIDITDSAEMRFSELNIRGNSVQKIREGYNELLNTAKKYTTDKGIIATFEEDGTIIVSGTATGTVDIQLCGVWASTKVQFSLKAGNYKYTSNNSGLKLYLANNTSAIYFSDNEVKALKDYSVTNAFIRIENGVTINSTIKPMLYLYQGTEREYEQYGVSPSVEYPSEVESCGDNVNLFDGAFRQGNASSITDTKNVFNNNNFVLKKGNYSFSTNLPTTFKWAIFGSNQEFPNSNSVSFNSSFKTLSTYNFTFNDDYYIGIMITKVDGNEITPNELNKYYFKIEKGTKATPYSPYGQGCINEVICNKNLAKILNGIWYNSTTQTFTTDIQGYGYMTKIKENSKITISKKNTGNRFVVITSKEEIAVNGTYSRAVFLESEGKTTKYTFTTQENEKYVFFGYYRGIDEDAKNLASQEIQIEISEVKTGYEVHKEQVYTIPTQQPMRSVGEIRDTFVKVDGKWVERHNIARYYITGNENWQLRDTSSNTTDNKIALFSLANPFDYKLDNNNKYALSNNFNVIEKIDNIVNMYVKGVGIAFYYNNTNLTYFLYINTNQHSTLEDFKTWLQAQYNAGTPVYVDYVLAEPIDIECTEEQSTILWDIEQNAKTYKNITHMYSTDKVSSNKKVIYKKDIETLLNNLQAIAISNATEEV